MLLVLLLVLCWFISLIPLMNPSFPIFRLPTALVVCVMQKMTAISFIRLRRTCKTLNAVAEFHRKYIGIVLDQIDLFPVFEYYWRRENKAALFTSAGEILFDIYKDPGDQIRNNTIRMGLPEAQRNLSGFTFSKVLCSSCTSCPATTFMVPHVLSEFMDFLREQKWSSKAASSTFTPMEILNIIKPNILQINDGNVVDIPRSVKTIEIPQMKCRPNIRNIPAYVENFLVYPFFESVDEFQVPSAVREIAMAFYDDKLSVSFIHLKRLQIEDETIQKMKIPWNNTAASVILQTCLFHTPYEKGEIVAFDKIVRRSTNSSITFNLLTTSNIVLISRNGMKGLLAIAIEAFIESRRLMEVSVYFWRDNLKYLAATDDYIEKPSSGIY